MARIPILASSEGGTQLGTPLNKAVINIRKSRKVLVAFFQNMINVRVFSILGETFPATWKAWDGGTPPEVGRRRFRQEAEP